MKGLKYKLLNELENISNVLCYCISQVFSFIYFRFFLITANKQVATDKQTGLVQTNRYERN